MKKLRSQRRANRVKHLTFRRLISYYFKTPLILLGNEGYKQWRSCDRIIYNMENIPVCNTSNINSANAKKMVVDYDKIYSELKDTPDYSHLP